MANRPISKREKIAWDFAKKLHTGQIRKFLGTPYFDAHVQKVNGIVKQYTTDIDILIAALLHDTLEDCYEDADVGYLELKEMFGERVADLVKELTSDNNDLQNGYDNNKTDYLIDKMLNMTDDALIIKLSDRLQNISDAFTASENFRNKYFLETDEIIKNLEANRTLNKIQILILEDIKYKLSNIKSIFYEKKVYKWIDFITEYDLTATINENSLADNIKKVFSDLGNKESMDFGRVRKIIQYLVQSRDSEVSLFGNKELVTTIRKYLNQIPKDKIDSLSKKSGEEIQNIFSHDAIKTLMKYLKDNNLL